MKVEAVKRDLVGAVIRKMHSPDLRLADSAQAELHLAVRSSFLSLDTVERSRVTGRRVTGIARALGNELDSGVRRTTSSRNEKLVVRRQLLRRAVDALGREWLMSNPGGDSMITSYFLSSGSEPHPSLSIEEVPLIGEPDCLERRFLVQENLVASALLEKNRDLCTFIWPLKADVPVSRVLNSFLSEVVDSSTEQSTRKLDGWCSDEHFELTFTEGVTGDQIYDKLMQNIGNRASCLELLEISSGGAVLELLIDNFTRQPSRLALVLDSVPAIPVMKFFTSFHRDEAIRDRYRKLDNAQTEMSSDAQKMFSPLPLTF